MDIHTTTRIPKGRPRNEATRQAVLQAALALVGERGYSNVTIQDIALRAGTTRQTIYRWWQALAEIYMEALSDQVRATSTPQFLAVDLQTHLLNIFTLMSGPYYAIVIGLFTDLRHNPEVARVYRSLLAMRLTALTQIIERFAADRQQKLAISPSLVAEMIAGAMWYRALHQTAPLDEAFASDLIRTVEHLLEPKT